MVSPKLADRVAQLAKNGRYEEAIALGERGLNDSPGRVALQMRMARIFAGLSQFDRAYAHLDAAESASEGKNAKVLVERARLDIYSGRGSGQQECLRAIEINPQQTQFVYYVAGHQLQGDFLIIDSLQVVYSPIPKAGSTSLKSMFLEHRTTDHPESVVGGHQRFDGKRARADRLRLGDVGMENVYSFSVDRDDVERFESYFARNVVQGEALRRAAGGRDKHFGLPTMPDIGYFAENLRAYRYVFADVQHHTLPARAFLHHDLAFYDDVFELTELDRLADRLAEHTGMQFTVPHRLQSGTSRPSSVLSNAARAAISTL